ncbi:MAG: hypothetical protein IJ030_00930 [Oscillospiraceae bacterium]|nr:hypothetical protein [Oscillospiraceae bacterium]
MKKAFALLLVLAMLIPMGLISASAEGEVTVQPFYSLGWSDFNNIKYPYLEGLLTTSFGNIGAKVKISYGSTGSITYGQYTDADVTKIAQAIKKDMDRRPEGMRYWHLFGPGKIYDLAPQNVVYLDFAVDQMKDLVTAVLKKYKEVGGVLDGLVVDTEYLPVTSYYLYTKTAVNDKLIYHKIVQDPRYATEIRPMLEERGFKFWPADKITEYTPEIYGISRDVKSEEYAESKNIWDTVMRIRMNNYINKWAFEPLREYFPEAGLSDYQSIDGVTWLKMAAVTDGGEVLSGGNSQKAGDTSSYSYYYSRPDDNFFKEHKQYAGYNDSFFEAKPFNNLLYDINFTRYVYGSSDTKKIAPWITSYVYRGKTNYSMAYTPYYSELLFHLGMFDPKPFLSYTYTPEYSDEDWIVTCEVMNSALEELSRVAGFSDRKTIATPLNWNSKFVLSGMYANGRNIWRITPDTTVVSLEDFKVEGTDPTFRVNGETVTFPGGKIIETAEVVTAGSCGYWVETAKDVTPVVTTDADRYAKYPSLNIDFENAREGKFDFNSSVPANAWEFTWKKGGNSVIQTVNGNKVLAINGETSVRSKNLPGNVTAGDSYAEDQAWEITVTVPEGLAANAEVVLLRYAGSGQKITDGGFKLAGGKLYYSQLKADGAAAEYVELTDLSAGTYTLKRLMDFNDGKAASTYYVYDAAGKELKASGKVAQPVFSSITTIEFSCVNADKDVLLDNYKISLTGTTIDFGLYDAKTGMAVATAAPRAASTAYRVSWLNATDKEETATVVAEIYEGETLKETKTVKELKMAPGCDGVETGIVEIAEGQSVKVSVKSAVKVSVIDPKAEKPAEPTTPGTATNPTAAPGASDPTQGTDANKGDNSTVIIIVAAVAVAVVAVVLALVLTKKKPAKKAEEAAEEASEEKTEE